jgi:hypothetical protein
MPEKTNDYACKVARTIKEAEQLVEEGLDYVTEIDGVKLFRKYKSHGHINEQRTLDFSLSNIPAK